MSAIETRQQTNKRYTVVISLGNTTETVKNLPAKMVRKYIRQVIEKRLRRFVNHRESVMKKHGGHYTLAKQEAINKVRRRLDQAPHWSFDVTLLMVERMREDLVLLLPGKDSKFYKNHVNLVTELLSWVSAARKGMAA